MHRLGPRGVLAGVVAILGCAGAAPAARSPSIVVAPAAPKVARPTGRVRLLASRGSSVAFRVGAEGRELMVGRVKLRLDPDGGATRLGVLMDTPPTSAALAPMYLDKGALALTPSSLLLARDGKLTALASGSYGVPSFGPTHAWTRNAEGSGDWLSVSLTTGAVSWTAAPLAAPVLPAAPAKWPDLGSTGPDFVSPSVGVVLTAVLGPMLSVDGGKSYHPMPKLPKGFLPSRIVRDASGGLWLVDRLVAVRVQANGALDAPTPLEVVTHLGVPRVASFLLEESLPEGAVMDDGTLVAADEDALALVQDDPVRLRSVTVLPTARSCLGIRRVGNGIVGVWRAHDALHGPHTVVGHVDLGGTPKWTAEMVFSAVVAVNLSSTGALVVAASCDGKHARDDLRAGDAFCVRDVTGKFHDVTTHRGTLAPWDLVVPRPDGSLVTGRSWKDTLSLHEANGALIARLPAFGELVAADTSTDGGLVLWSTLGTTLVATKVSKSVVARHTHPLPLGTQIGVFGERVLVARALLDGVAGEVSVDGGVTYQPMAWPSHTRPLLASGGVACGALGCQVFGWTRLGYQGELAGADTPVDPPPPETPAPAKHKRPHDLHATCTPIAPEKTIDPKLVPTEDDAGRTEDVGLTQPGPNTIRRANHFASGAVSGVLVSNVPLSGNVEPLGTVARFTTDLDVVGAIHVAKSPATLLRSEKEQPTATPFVLGPGRVLVAQCDDACRLLRLVGGGPIEVVPAPEGFVIRELGGARELGGSLLVVGHATVDGSDTPLGFAATLKAGKWTTTIFRDERPSHAMVDVARGRFGLRITSDAPSSVGGSAFAVTVDPPTKLVPVFESLVGAGLASAQPTAPCLPTGPGWEWEEQLPADMHVSVELTSNPAKELVPFRTGTVRFRATATAACLTRITMVDSKGAFQWSAASGRASYQRRIHVLESDSLDRSGKLVGVRRDLSCKFAFGDVSAG